MSEAARREVVVTGVGAICSQALSPGQLFDRLRNGQSSIRNHAALEACGLPNPACAYIDDEVWAMLESDQSMHCSHLLGPQARLALHAAGQALASSGIDIRGCRRSGLFVASNKYTFTQQNLLDLGSHYDPAADRIDLDSYMHSSARHRNRYFDKRQDMAALALADAYGCDRVVMTCGDACAAGGIAVGNGYRHIRHGELDVALVGGTEAMCNYVPMIGFGVLGALCPQRSDQPETLSRPFDKSRNGFVMGEGSAFLVLESLEHARLRGAPILARLSGFAKQAEAWRITASPSNGSQYARCIRAALEDAQLPPEAIGHVNAHGTSTQQNDSCESIALKSVFGDRIAKLPVTSSKSALGHSLAASGAIEAVLSVLSLQQQILLPTLNFQEGDATTDGLDIVMQARRATFDHVLSNSFGFGGENCALIFSRAKHEVSEQ